MKNPSRSVFSFIKLLLYLALALAVSCLVYGTFGWLGVAIVCAVYAFSFWVWAVVVSHVFTQASRTNMRAKPMGEMNESISQDASPDGLHKEVSDYANMLEQKND